DFIHILPNQEGIPIGLITMQPFAVLTYVFPIVVGTTDVQLLPGSFFFLFTKVAVAFILFEFVDLDVPLPYPVKKVDGCFTIEESPELVERFCIGFDTQ